MAIRRRWRRLAATIAVTALLVAGVVVALNRILLDHECTVTVGDDEVSFSTEQAELLSAGKLADLSEEDEALVQRALSGRARYALSCRHGGADDEEHDALNDRGLTGRADVVRRDLGDRFGRLALGGYAPGGVSTGHKEGSAHYEGRAIDVFFRPINPANLRRGWAVAHYLVANAERLSIDTVIYNGKIWTARRSFQGWRDYEIDTKGRPAGVRKVLLHHDHVHVDVAD